MSPLACHRACAPRLADGGHALCAQQHAEGHRLQSVPNVLIGRYPKLETIGGGNTRADAIWLATNWMRIAAWLETLPAAYVGRSTIRLPSNGVGRPPTGLQLHLRATSQLPQPEPPNRSSCRNRLTCSAAHRAALRVDYHVHVGRPARGHALRQSQRFVCPAADPLAPERVDSRRTTTRGQVRVRGIESLRFDDRRPSRRPRTYF